MLQGVSDQSAICNAEGDDKAGKDGRSRVDLSGFNTRWSSTSGTISLPNLHVAKNVQQPRDEARATTAGKPRLRPAPAPSGGLLHRPYEVLLHLDEHIESPNDTNILSTISCQICLVDSLAVVVCLPMGRPCYTSTDQAKLTSQHSSEPSVDSVASLSLIRAFCVRLTLCQLPVFALCKHGIVFG